MKYQSKADTIQVRQVTEDELIEDGDLEVGADGREFHVKVSSVGNGWWTRAELTALRDKLTGLIDSPVPAQRFRTDSGIAIHPYDAAYDRGYLDKRPDDSSLPEIRAAVARMLADRARGEMASEIPGR